VSASAKLHEDLCWWANAIGVTGAPFDSFLTLRGVRTLHARMRVHAENTAVIVDFLQQHAAVERVYYPGLADNPGHEIARRQQSCFGAMLSFELLGGEPAVAAFLAGLQCFTLAESLGGVESLIAHPATMTHAGMEESARLRAGIGPGLLRMSVGIEAHGDLIADLAAGLERAAKVQPTPHRQRRAS
jgi:cystathionine gamma-synthase